MSTMNETIDTLHVNAEVKENSNLFALEMSAKYLTKILFFRGKFFSNFPYRGNKVLKKKIKEKKVESFFFFFFFTREIKY